MTDSTYVKSHCPRAVDVLVAINPDQRVSTLIQRALQTDDYELEFRRGLCTDVVGDFRHVCVVESCVNLVKDEEWCRLIAEKGGKLAKPSGPNIDQENKPVDGKEQRQCGDGLLSA